MQRSRLGAIALLITRGLRACTCAPGEALTSMKIIFRTDRSRCTRKDLIDNVVPAFERRRPDAVRLACIDDAQGQRLEGPIGTRSRRQESPCWRSAPVTE